MSFKTTALFLLLPFLLFSQNIIRGPYLQQPTSESIIIRWRTDSLTDSKVWFGSGISSLNQIIVDTTLTTEHSVKITGLSSFTKYFYAVGTSAQMLSPADFDHYFVTAVQAGAIQPVRIWAIGDFGKGTSGQAQVRDSYLNYADSTHTDVWLWLGDNVYYSGYDSEYQHKVFEGVNSYRNVFKNLPFWAAPGNHDYEVICAVPCNKDPLTHTGPYYDIINAPTAAEAGGLASGTELYYSFDYGNIHFISLNSELGSFTAAYDWIGASPLAAFTSSPMTQWLENDLQQNDKPWVIAFWHQPPYSSCTQVNSDDTWQRYVIAMRENIIPILEQHGVDLVLCGHSHVYHRSYLLNGHYGFSSSFHDSMKVNATSGKENLGEAYLKAPGSKGTVYVVQGNSGSDDRLLPQHPAFYFSDGGDTIFGSFIIDIHGDTLRGKYLQANSQQILDEFTILKTTQTGVLNKSVGQKLSLHPNPFKNATTIRYYIEKSSNVKIELLDVSGKKIRTLVNERKAAGQHEFLFNSKLASGVYFIKLSTENGSTLEKMTVVSK